MAAREDRGDQRLSQEDLNCSCCFEPMVEPTTCTLNCGHSFCRFCLAQWWTASKRATCPECREPWAGFPNVNIVLRLELIRNMQYSIVTDAVVSQVQLNKLSYFIITIILQGIFDGPSCLGSTPYISFTDHPLWLLLSFKLK